MLDHPAPDHRTSRLLLARLATLPRLAVPAVALLLMLVGLMASPPWAIPALALLLALVAWLASLAWPHADRHGRGVRMIAVGGLAAILVVRLVQSTG